VLAGWEERGLTVDDLFYIVRANMPPGASKALSTEERLDVVAYMLQKNGLPAGDTPLRAEAAYLTGLALTSGETGPSGPRAEAPAYLEGPGGTEPQGSGPTAAELAANREGGEDWLYHTGAYGGSRYSSLRQITTGNVADLGVVCRYTMGEQSNMETGPVVHAGTMYVTTVHQTAAIDAATCTERWTHMWDAPAGDVWGNNRGVAISAGRVIRGTSDGYLVALDAETGALLWARQVADAKKGETITMVPLIWQDLVLVGPAGNENAIKGWVGAFSVEDGTQVWRFDLVPGPGEPGYDSWNHDNDFPMGGGATWTPMSMDVDAGIVFVAAGNPAPDFPAEKRGGDNLYTNSVVALDARTGHLAWYEQLVPEDDHDWDLTQVSPAFSASALGRDRKLIATVGKDGMLRLLDRDTQHVLWETAVTTQDNRDAPVTVEGTHACPGVLGGVEWNGPAYNPAAHMLYTPAVDWCGTYYAADTVRFVPGADYLGGTYMFDADSRGWLTAVDVETGDVAWRYESPRPMVGAVLSTAGGLVLAGEVTGDLIAFQADSGRELARIPVGAPVGGGVVTYAVDQRQYVAAATGRPSPFWVSEDVGLPTIVVLSLGGEGP
jgi:alcohol dehydrogenase (cytochrome c)